MKRKFLPKLYLFLLLLPLSVLATEGSESLVKAEAAFQNGRFEEARESYRKLFNDANITNPAPFYYNYGTVLMKTGDLGGAYGLLMKALVLRPADGDIRNNLEFVRSQLPAASLNIRPDALLSAPPQELLHLSATACLMLLLLSLAIFSGQYAINRGTKITRALALLFYFVFAAAFASCQIFSGEHLAVVNAKDAKLHSGPSTNFPEIMPLESGSLVSISDGRDGWVKLNFLLKSEKNKEIVGWMEEKSVLTISD